ncbi:hypothetical protein QC762_0064320 [Podospora pseudocomata]|uniref:Uncharacterized protein n=2 Tax=Podospora TaxID=5144 RepID=A0ABR0GF48_9PEZI|nr:hypothetical protein QC761_0064050 [Podospora bellae-mahoneyi]KAK4654313.1 hypothetical protein QC762_0064320 [Podospora pseudocomata]
MGQGLRSSPLTFEASKGNLFEKFPLSGLDRTACPSDAFIESNPIVSQIPGFRSKSLVNPRSPLISTLTVSLQASSLPRSTKLR